MPQLISAGVRVFVQDLSIYSSPNPTTIPLVVLATRRNKTAPDGTGTALGTVEREKLRLVASQRELLQNYGNPVFVTSAGDPVFGDETCEYGLFAAWSFLGRGNRAYILRADVDVGQLVPSTNEPVLPPPDGTYWIDSDAVVGGIFKFNGTAWVAQGFRVATTPLTGADGVNGDWAFDYSNLDGTIRYKEGGTWKPATGANLIADFGATCNLFVQPTAPVGPQSGDFWYKTTQASGGTNLKLARFRAVDGVFVSQPVIRQPSMPTPNQNTVWEDTSEIANTGARPLYVGTGTQFIPLPVVVQPNQPVSDPETGTLWYNDTFTDFALYVEGTDFGRGNEWVPVVTTTVSNPTAQQKVISGSAPQFPAEGAIWVDIRNPQNFDNYPIIKRYTLGAWVDITRNVKITDQDPLAAAVVNGTFWLNLGQSNTTFTVKRFNPDYIPKKVILDGGFYTVVEETDNHWEPAAGATFGRKAQREVIVEGMQRAIVANEEVRNDVNYFQLIAAPGYPELYDEMLALNTDNNETAFIVADTPKFMRPSGIPTGREVTVAEWMTNSNNVAATGESGFSSAPTPYAGFWFPWCLSTNVTDGQDVFAPPSHMVLRAISYSDSVAAPWFPPAGYTRGRVDNATSVGYLDNDGDYVPLIMTRSMRDIAYQNRINPITFIPNRGLVIFGQKTNSAVASALDRVNVARLIAKMKYDLQRLLEPFLFEINDAVTRRSAQVVTERYLAGLKSLRALYDYAVRCDESNNTPDRIDRNELWVDVAIKPAKAIEFIYVPITVLGTGDEFPF